MTCAPSLDFMSGTSEDGIRTPSMKLKGNRWSAKILCWFVAISMMCAGSRLPPLADFNAHQPAEQISVFLIVAHPDLIVVQEGWIDIEKVLRVEDELRVPQPPKRVAGRFITQLQIDGRPGGDSPV